MISTTTFQIWSKQTAQKITNMYLCGTKLNQYEESLERQEIPTDNFFNNSCVKTESLYLHKDENPTIL